MPLEHHYMNKFSIKQILSGHNKFNSLEDLKKYLILLYATNNLSELVEKK